MITRILFIFTILLTLYSCTIEKRKYTKGYHIEWNNNLVHKKSVTNVEKEIIVDNIAAVNTKVEVVEEEKIITVKHSPIVNKKANKSQLKKDPVIKKSVVKEVANVVDLQVAQKQSKFTIAKVADKGKLEYKEKAKWWERKTILGFKPSVRNATAISILGALLISFLIVFFDVALMEMRLKGFVLGAIIFLGLVTILSPIMTIVFGDPINVLPNLLKTYFTLLLLGLPSIIGGGTSIARAESGQAF